MNISIVGLGHALPNNIVTNQDLSAKLDTNDEWIKSRTGIAQRHIAPHGTCTSDLALIALKEALQDSKFKIDDIDGIILSTTTPDLLMPSAATIVQNKIGMKHGFAFDIHAACSGFLYALHSGYCMIKSGQARSLAIIGAETMSRIIDWQDRSTCVLFGDGAGAVILSNKDSTNNSDILSINIHSDGSFLNILKVAGGVSYGSIDAKLQMNGQEVYKFAVDKMSESLMQNMHKNGISPKDLSLVIAHQANARIISSVANRLGISMDKVAITVDQHANTSAASIPLALYSYYANGKLKKGNLIALVAVGAGMTWGSALLKY